MPRRSRRSSSPSPPTPIVPVVPPAVGQRPLPAGVEELPARDRAGRRHRQGRRPADAGERAGRGLGLRGRPRHDPPRPADRHAREEAAVGHRQVVRGSGADRADPPGRRGRPPGEGADLARSQRRGAAGRRPRRPDLGRAEHARLPVAILRAAAGRPRVHGNAGGRGGGRSRRSARRRHRRRRHAFGRHRRRRARDPVRAPEFVEREYNNRAACPDHPHWFAEYARRSAAAYADLDVRRDLRYGPGERETLDLFVPRGPARGTLRVHPRRVLAGARQGGLRLRRRAVRRPRHRRRQRQLRPVSRRDRRRHRRRDAGVRSAGSPARASGTAPALRAWSSAATPPAGTWRQ